MAIRFKNTNIRRNSVSFFIQLLVSFIVVILIMTMFYAISYKYYFNKYKQQMIKKIERQFVDICDEIDLEIDDIYKKFMGIVQDNMCFSILTGENIDGYGLYYIVKRLRAFEYGNHVKPYSFIMSKNSNFIIGSDATYRKDLFFDNVLYNTQYNYGFWENQIEEGYDLNFFPGDLFYTKTQKDKIYFVPVICKYYKNQFFMATLIDFNKMINSFEYDYADGFFIIDKSATSIFTDTEITKKTGTVIPHLENIRGTGYMNMNEGYLFYYKSPVYNLIYCKYIEHGKIGSGLNQINNIFITALSFAFSICMLLAVYIVKSLNMPLKHICNLLNNYDSFSTLPHNMHHLKRSVENLIKSNISYTSEMGSLNSMMSEMLYQAKIHNLPLSYDGRMQGFVLKESYYMVLIRLHEKDTDDVNDINNTNNANGINVTDAVNAINVVNACIAANGKVAAGADSVKNEDTIVCLKHAFDERISNLFKEQITFQTESNELVSIINNNDKQENVYALLNTVFDGISKNFLYTAVVSKKQSVPSQLGQIYTKLSSSVFNRQLISKSQVLYEDAIGICSKFAKFTTDQQAKLINLLCTGNSDAVIDYIFDILDNNAELNINNLCFNILCIEIASIILKYVEQNCKVNDIININLFYGNMSECATLYQYKIEIRRFIDEVFCLISKQIKYNYNIIEFVKDFVETNYSKDIYLDLVANELNISKSYLSFYFKNVTGIGFVEYVNQYRVEKSKEQLRTSDLTVNETAINCGFNNVTSFIRTFKKYTGMTPKEYQRNIIQS